MKVGIGTLGWTVGYLKPLIDGGEGIQKIVFYYGWVEKENFREKTLKAKKELEELCESFGLKYEGIKLDNIFDFNSIVRRMKADIEKEQKEGNEVVKFDIAGGTKIMVASALMVSLFKGIPAIYCDEDSKATVKLPLLGNKFESGLTPREKEIVRFVIDYKGAEVLTETHLAKLLGKEKGTVNPQVLTLVKKGALEFKKIDNHKIRIVQAVEGFDLLLELMERSGDKDEGTGKHNRKGH